MNTKYEELDMNVFSDIEAINLTDVEKKRLLKNFKHTAGTKRKPRGQLKRALSLVACMCIIVCGVVTPIRSSVWASVESLYTKIGSYLGNNVENEYATYVGQTVTDGNMTATLNEAIGDDNKIRWSITCKSDDIEKYRKSNFEISQTSINGFVLGNKADEKAGLKGIIATGYGIYGWTQKEDSVTMLGDCSFVNYKMPDNPEIKLVFTASNKDKKLSKKFVFDFTLDTDKVKTATKTVPINKEFQYQGKTYTVKDLIVSPITQKITFVGGNDQQKQDYRGPDLQLAGTDDSGRKVSFLSSFAKEMVGYYEDESYELNQNVKEYHLQLSVIDDSNNDGILDYHKVGNAFTIKVNK